MITAEILAKALNAVRGIKMTTAHGYNVSPADTVRCALAAVLPLIRDAALEEAAKVADARELRWSEDAEQSNSGTAAHIFRRKADAAEQIAAAIRSMKGQEIAPAEAK